MPFHPSLSTSSPPSPSMPAAHPSSPSPAHHKPPFPKSPGKPLFTALALSLLLHAHQPSAPAQTITRVLEGLFGQSSSQKTDPQQSASQQLPYAQERAASARQKFDFLRSPQFQNRLEKADFPENQRERFLQESASSLENWNNAIAVLQGIQAREAVPPSQQLQPPPPQNARQALELDKELSAARQSLAQNELDKKTQAEALEAAEQRLRLARRQLQLLEDSQRSAPSPPTDRDALELLLAEIALDAAQAAVFLLRWTGWRNQLDELNLRTRITNLENALQAGGFHKMLHPERAAGQIAAISDRIQTVQKSLDHISNLFKEASNEATHLRKKAAQTPNPEDPSAAATQRQLQQQLTFIETLERLQTALRARLQFLRQVTAIWNRASELSQTHNLPNIRTLRSDLLTLRNDLTTASLRVDRGLAEARNRLETTRLRLQTRGLTQPEKAILEKEQQITNSLLENLIALKNEISEFSALQEKLTSELDALLLQTKATENIAYYFRQIATGLLQFWQFPLLEHSGRSITIGTLISALIALALALLLARIFAARLGGTLRNRFKMAEAQADLAQKLTLYALSVALVLMVLQWLSIPLTVFAFLGGALAVGIGFGSQNLINNFISGLIVLFERKVSVGHLLEVDGRFGRVTNLGSRCASIQTFDGVEVLIPNSSLLEKNVINWTLSDPRHRYDWTVGVSYNSDVDLVFSTLRQVIQNRPEILRQPEPEIALENFADSSLIFHVYYWIEIGTCNPRQVASEMRRELLSLFRERGIEIPFPQHEVHLHKNT